MAYQRVHQSKSQSKSSDIEVSNILRRSGVIQRASEQKNPSEEETEKNPWRESPLMKNFQTPPVHSPSNSSFLPNIVNTRVSIKVLDPSAESGVREWSPDPVNITRPLQMNKSIPPAPQREKIQLQGMKSIKTVASRHPLSQFQAPTAETAGYSVIQGKGRKTDAPTVPPTIERSNQTGLPGNLKAGIENLSGFSMDDVRVHYNSLKPAQLQARAYTQGTDIYVGPGQSRHLPHEAWHTVQQKQGRVKPTIQAKGVSINDEAVLEKEADVMGALAVQKNVITEKQEEKEKDTGAGLVQQKKLSENVIEKRPQHQASVIQRAQATISKVGLLMNLADFATSSKSRAVLPLKTSVTFGIDKLTTTKEVVGTKMEAKVLGPDHPQGGTPDPSASKGHIQGMKTKYPKEKYIRGHLLNDNLGGPGLAANLFPITAQANSLHYQKVEKDIKQEVNDNHYYMYYSVEVKNRDDKNGKADFYCEFGYIDTKNNKFTRTPPAGQVIIHSEPGGKSNFSGSSGVNQIPSKVKKSFAKAKLYPQDIVELSMGKAPAGYLDIEQSIIDDLIAQATSNKGFNMDKVGQKISHLKGLGKEMADSIALFIITGDESIFENMNMGAWNKAVKIINDNL